MKRFGCVIMASGLGVRFGGNKLMVDFLGQPLIGRVLDVTQEGFANRVVVTRHADVAAYCTKRQIEVILHEQPYRSDTVRLGLERMQEMDGCLFCPGDQPLLRKETVAALLAAASEEEAIWRPAWEGMQGAPVLFPKCCFEELLTLPQGRGGNWLIKKYPELVRIVPVRDRYELSDVDRQEDLLVLTDLLR